MNQQLKTVLLTILTLSFFVIAIVELTGISKTALFNKYGIGSSDEHNHVNEQAGNTDVANMPKTEMTFQETKHNFGKIKEGDVVKHAYKFTNTGEHPLIITKADAACGCTVPSYPKEPIPPGGSGEIVVEFNSSNKVGHQSKNVIIHSNAQMEAISIGFDADVEKK